MNDVFDQLRAHWNRRSCRCACRIPREKVVEFFRLSAYVYGRYVRRLVASNVGGSMGCNDLHKRIILKARKDVGVRRANAGVLRVRRLDCRDIRTPIERLPSRFLFVSLPTQQGMFSCAYTYHARGCGCFLLSCWPMVNMVCLPESRIVFLTWYVADSTRSL